MVVVVGWARTGGRRTGEVVWVESRRVLVAALYSRLVVGVVVQGSPPAVVAVAVPDSRPVAVVVALDNHPVVVAVADLDTHFDVAAVDVIVKWLLIKIPFFSPAGMKRR